MKNPVAKHLHKSCKPSVVPNKKEEKILEELDKDIVLGYYSPIPVELFERIAEIQSKAENARFSSGDTYKQDIYTDEYDCLTDIGTANMNMED